MYMCCSFFLTSVLSYHGEGNWEWISIGCSRHNTRYSSLIILFVETDYRRSKYYFCACSYVIYIACSCLLVVCCIEIAANMGKSLHFNTYGGNPMASAVGSTVLDVSHACTCQYVHVHVPYNAIVYVHVPYIIIKISRCIINILIS